MAQGVGKKLSRQSLSVQIAERLKEEISNGIYLPGTVLPSEVTLSKDYAVSRPVIREAFKLLSAQGFVHVANGKGAIVREINDEPLRVFFRRLLGKGSRGFVIDLFEVRAVLEDMSVALAAKNRTTHDLQILRRTLDRMAENIHDPAAYSLLDVEFHLQLAQMSRNAFLFHLITSIRESLLSVVSSLRAELRASQLPLIQEHHEGIYYAVEHQDSDEAQRAMARHSESVMERLPSNLKKRAKSPSTYRKTAG